ncbi:MAG: phosphate signaling complex protein PhoU [Deltaproteobacteria bacterium]|nr:phosphate signaling complex protein PhoU [Deltaproteobacteria bacterium]
MPVRYRKEVEEIRNRLTQLAAMVTANVNRAMDAVVSADAAAAGRVIRDELEINRREVALEEACIKVISLHQPVADELRFLVATIKINHDLERVGDLAAGIAKRVRAVTPEDIGPFKISLQGLVVDLGNKLKESMTAFFERNHEQATRLWLGDDAVDARAAALGDAIRTAILNQPTRPGALFTLLAIVQRIERLADHAANIAKNAIYLALGEIVRHRMGEFRKQTESGKPKVLMVCVHNSARSQMAAAWINHLFGDRIEAESAGLQPGVLNPLAVRAMQEVGIDISGARTRDVFEVVRSGHPFSHVVTVCDEVNAEKCPPFPGVENVQHWDLPDPAAQPGDEEEKMGKFREIRDALRRRIEAWLAKSDS